MDKQAQDERWSKLSQEEREGLMEAYKRNPDSCLFSTRYFGSHNLNPKPPTPKTWGDFVKEFHKETDWNPKNEFTDLPLYGIDDKVKSKIIATAKIAKLIDLGYGGMVSEEEMKDTSIDIYNIYPDEKKQLIIGCLNTRLYDFICFHNRQQAEEFMSYESNRSLVKQYYMM